MKTLLLSGLILLSVMARGQKLNALNAVGGTDTVQNGQAIIYGNFIQRLKFTSGGFPQDIRIMNVDTKEIFSFRVKPTFKSAKENVFCYFINPGTYVLLNYWYTESKWYGGKTYTEPVKSAKNAPFRFTVQQNGLYYLGDWHFDTQDISFTDNKTTVDELLKSKYHRLDLSAAVTALPVSN